MRVARFVLVAGAAISCWLVAPVPAHADNLGGAQEEEEQTDTSSDSAGGGTISAQVARITFTSTGGGGSSGEALSSTTGWTPPACYYAPVYTPTEMEAYREEWLRQFTTPPWPPEDARSVREGNEARFGPDGEFPDYNKDREGEGLFWTVVRNEDYPLAEQFVCDRRIFWVEFEDAPPVRPGVVDTGTLSELAWERTRVPGTEVSLNPEGRRDACSDVGQGAG